ncbi:ComEA family DNA-binding protein [Streptomyces sp. Qhu-G9]|uniref:ComEA family DNA-binding protein n=1 Tax=Streptomyces sp. Qhu-G9 TaxID=3452799 RepID=UPI0022AC7C76|nr:ComEA family DNA-binding protein [Streptomyces aurantiacus]WAU79717.1 ComEA family DNA-binding protein [Streptomyces aurantiacus]
MALRSPSRITAATSGPGRGPVSDGRTRHRRRPCRGGSRRRQASAEALRLRAETLFAERTRVRGELRHGPPATARDEPIVQGEPREPRVPHVPRWARAGGADPGGGFGDEGDAPAGAGVGVSARVRAGVVTDAEVVTGPGGRGDEDPAGAAWRERAGLAVRERMPLWLQSRCGLERRSVAALAVVLVVAAVFAGQHFWSGRTQPVRAPEVVRAAVPYGEEGENSHRNASGASAAAQGPAPAGAVGTAIVVDVSGKVREPGIHRLPAGSRVEDALKAAGGVRPGTDTEGLNRARFLVDGEQVVVGAPATVAGPGAAGTAGGTGGTAAGGAASAPVALNTATLEQLDTLPGVGPVLAQHIVDYRTQHGGFRSVDELREVNGIGDRRFADLQNLVRP